MSDQASVDGGQADQDQAAAATPAHDWEKDYKELQATYTQGQQRLRELEAYENDRDAYFRLGEKHGVQFEIEDDQAQQGVDPELAALRQQMAEQTAWREQVEAERQQERAAAGEELFHQDLDEWAETEGVKLSQADHNAIFGLLMKAPDPTQESTARQIFDAHIAHKKTEREAWEQEYEQARKRPRVPTAPVNGQQATGQPDWSAMTPEEIDQYMAERVRSA